MKKVKRGRPKADVGLQKEEILKVALEILDQSGPHDFSMRKVAEKLNVTPMALYNHFLNRSALVRELSDRVYSQVSKDSDKKAGGARQKLETLLTSYHKAVLKHPNLTLSIFADPDALSLEAERITQKIVELLGEAKISASESRIWLNILVDFTHGSSVATAICCLNSGKRAELTREQSADYQKGLRKLLDFAFLGAAY